MDGSIEETSRYRFISTIYHLRHVLRDDIDIVSPDPHAPSSSAIQRLDASTHAPQAPAPPALEAPAPPSASQAQPHPPRASQATPPLSAPQAPPPPSAP